MRVRVGAGLRDVGFDLNLKWRNWVVLSNLFSSLTLRLCSCRQRRGGQSLPCHRDGPGEGVTPTLEGSSEPTTFRALGFPRRPFTKGFYSGTGDSCLFVINCEGRRIRFAST